MVVTFGLVAAGGGLALDAGAACPTDTAGKPLILDVYCNDTSLANGAAGFELMDPARGWLPAARAAMAAGSVPARGSEDRTAGSSGSAAGHGSAGSTASVVLEVAAGAGVPARVRYAYADWPVSGVRYGAGGHALPTRGFDAPVPPAP